MNTVFAAGTVGLIGLGAYYDHKANIRAVKQRKVWAAKAAVKRQQRATDKADLEGFRQKYPGKAA